MFRTVPLYIIMSISLYTQQCYTSYSVQDQDGNQFRPDPARKLYDIYHCCVYSEKTPYDGHRGTVRNM